MFPANFQSNIFSSHRFNLKRGAVFGVLIFAALMSFEMFNYSTTEYSLLDLLGGLEFLGISWATILTIAFCTIDFAGLARLFTPEQGADEPAEVWYLFGAWILAAIMNAILTWWGVSVAIANHIPSVNTFISRETVADVVPVFVAIMVFLIRVLIIGTFSVAGDRLFSQGNARSRAINKNQFGPKSQNPMNYPATQQPYKNPVPQTNFRPMPKPMSVGQSRPEPSYHPITATGRNDPGNQIP